MKKRKVIFLVVLVLVIFLSLILFLLTPFYSTITAKVPTSGSITITILEMLKINITYPENRTYDFNFSERSNLDSLKPPYFFEMPVNATSNRGIETWEYWVRDENSEYDNFSITYSTPMNNFSTIENFSGGTNSLFMYGVAPEGSHAEDNVTFFINITGAAPQIVLNETEFYFCEGSEFSEKVEVIDPNEDINIFSSTSFIINPKDPFYSRHESKIGTTYTYELYERGFSREDFNFLEGAFTKESFNLTVMDMASFSDSKEINITIFLVNHIPSIESSENVYIKLYNKGEGRVYDNTFKIFDFEDGNLSDGNLTVSLTYANGTDFELFDINNVTGGVFYETTNSSPLGSYNLTLNVTDRGLPFAHENLSEICSGSTNESLTSTIFINLLITDDNRMPEITGYYPINESLEVGGEEELYFNISVWDDDHDPLITEWYVENKQIERHEEILYNSSDEFEYTFGCGIGGWHNITVFLKDADNLPNVNHTWQVYVNEVPCPEKPSGGGGGGPSNICYEDWVCEDWSTCQSLKGTYQQELIDSGDYQIFIEQCKQLDYDQEHWGFQMRRCYDINNCSNFEYRYEMPSTSQVCFYTEHPSCSDGIKNCHDGGCEQAIDCGGPCSACPTCSDGMKNQGEEGIDCGGPCPYPCEKTVADVRPNILLILIILLILVLLFVLYRIIIIMKKRREKKESSRQERIQKLFHQE